MSATIRKPRRRTPTDGGASPVPAPHRVPPLSAEQLRTLHAVYTLVLSHGSPAGVP